MKKLMMIGVTLLVLVSSHVMAELVVIVHPSHGDTELSQDDVKKLFLGKVSQFPDASPAIPIDQKSAKVRDVFYKTFMNKSESQLTSYWSKITFTGKGQPPQRESNDTSVKELVAANPNLIGYIDSSMVDDSVKVIFRMT